MGVDHISIEEIGAKPCKYLLSFVESAGQWKLFSAAGQGSAHTQRRWQSPDAGDTHHS
jgi:hypothetical protein